MEQETIVELGKALYRATVDRKQTKVISECYPDVTVEDAYAIQKVMIEEYLAQGAVLSGRKVGMTSAAMRKQFNIDEPDYGWLFEHLKFQGGEPIPQDLFIEPMVEAELAFVLKEDLDGPMVTKEQVLDATEYVVAALEIIDARTRHFDTILEDSIADNASFAAYVLGDQPIDPRAKDLSLIGLLVEKNGRQITTSSGASVMGSPEEAVVWLANKMISLGAPLRAGETVLAGSFVAAVPMEPGDIFRAKYGTFGEVTAIF